MFQNILDSNKYIVIPTEKAQSQIHIHNGSVQESLEDLVYVSSIKDCAFLDKKDFENQNHQHTAELFAFGYYNGRNIGSARHINGDFYQIKGAGRNQLAIRNDYEHAWGGLEQNIGFREYVMANVLRGLDAQSVVNYFAFGSYRIKTMPQSAFILRGKFLPRLVQLSPFNLSEREIQNIKVELSHVQINSLTDLIQTHIKKFVNLLLLGFYHTSYNFENITLDGKVLDAASLICRYNKDILSIPEFIYEGVKQNYFYFLRRILLKSVIPVGEKLFSEIFLINELQHEFVKALEDLKVTPEAGSILLKLFNEERVELAPIHQHAKITELHVSYSPGVISSTLETLIQKKYAIWKKIQPHSEEDAKVVLEQLIESYK